MLWRVEGTDKFFLSSMHLLPEHDAGLDARIWHLLPQMSRVVFESDISNAKAPDFATYQDGRRLHQIIPADLYAKCTELWKALNIDANLDLCKPWSAALLIGISIAMKNGFSLDRGVEQQLLASVSADRRAYLEHPDRASLPFDQAPMSEQVLQLHVCSVGEEAIMAVFMSLYKAWRSSDLETLSSILNNYMAILPSTYAGLINERNRAWAPTIVNFLTDPDSTLFVLGALHYVGIDKFPDCLNGSREYKFVKIC